MDLIVIPAIVVISYLITEIFKLFRVNKKYLPIIAGCSGLVVGLLSYIFVPEVINGTNLLTTLAIGIISGLSSTGSNQLIKQLLKKE